MTNQLKQTAAASDNSEGRVLVLRVQKYAQAMGIENGNQLRLQFKENCSPILANRLFAETFRRLDLKTLTRVYKFFKIEPSGMIRWNNSKRQRIVIDVQALAKAHGIENGSQLAEKLTEVVGAERYPPLGRRLYSNGFRRIDLTTLGALFDLFKIKKIPAPFQWLIGEQAEAYLEKITGANIDLDDNPVGRPSNKRLAAVEERAKAERKAKRASKATPKVVSTVADSKPVEVNKSVAASKPVSDVQPKSAVQPLRVVDNGKAVRPKQTPAERLEKKALAEKARRLRIKQERAAAATEAKAEA